MLSHRDFIPDLVCSRWHHLLDIRESVARKGGKGREYCNDGVNRTELDNLVKVLVDNTAMSEDALKVLEGSSEFPYFLPHWFLLAFTIECRAADTVMQGAPWQRQHVKLEAAQGHNRGQTVCKAVWPLCWAGEHWVREWGQCMEQEAAQGHDRGQTVHEVVWPLR